MRPPTRLPPDTNVPAAVSVVSRLLSSWPLNAWAGPAWDPALMSIAKPQPLGPVAAVGASLVPRRCLRPASHSCWGGLLLPSLTAALLKSNYFRTSENWSWKGLVRPAVCPPPALPVPLTFPLPYLLHNPQSPLSSCFSPSRGPQPVPHYPLFSLFPSMALLPFPSSLPQTWCSDLDRRSLPCSLGMAAERDQGWSHASGST